MSTASRRREVIAWVVGVLVLGLVVTVAALVQRTSRGPAPAPSPGVSEAGPAPRTECRQGSVPRVVDARGGDVVVSEGVHVRLDPAWREPVAPEQWPWLETVGGARQRLGPPDQQWWAGASLGELPTTAASRAPADLAGDVVACLQQAGPFETSETTGRPIQLVRSEAVDRDGLTGWRRSVVLGNDSPQQWDGWAVDVTVVRATSRGATAPWVVLTDVAPVGEESAEAAVARVRRSLGG